VHTSAVSAPGIAPRFTGHLSHLAYAPVTALPHPRPSRGSCFSSMWGRSPRDHDVFARRVSPAGDNLFSSRDRPSDTFLSLVLLHAAGRARKERPKRGPAPRPDPSPEKALDIFRSRLPQAPPRRPPARSPVRTDPSQAERARRQLAAALWVSMSGPISGRHGRALCDATHMKALRRRVQPSRPLRAPGSGRGRVVPIVGMGS